MEHGRPAPRGMITYFKYDSLTLINIECLHKLQFLFIL